MTVSHQLSLRLFLEGIEVPVIGATITSAANTPATCALQVIATDKILELLPRTLVHLFFYDFVGREAETTGLPEDIENSAYKLLFVGEVQGLAFQKSASTRDAMLNCVDLSNYWDTTYQYNFKGSLLGGRKHASFIGANANYFNGPLGHGVGTIAALLNANSVNYPDLKGLLGGIVRILETIGGAYYGDTTFRGANDFTAIAELRLKILQQICAAEQDSSTARLFARKTFNMWMNRQMGGLPKLVTFRGLTQLLQKFIYHDIYPCPVPKYVPRIPKATKTKVYSIDVAKDPKSRVFIKEVKKIRNLLRSASQNLGSYSNAMTPDDIADYADQTTSTESEGVSEERVTKGAVIRGLSADLGEANRLVKKLIVGSVPKVPGLGQEITNVSSYLQVVNKTIGPGPATLYSANLNVNVGKLGIGKYRRAAYNAVSNAIESCESMLGLKIKRKRDVTYDKLDRLNNQILRPDIWFTPPPRCNVIFPELYTNFSWSRNFLREVSRLELQTTHEILGDDALFNGRYYSPNVADMRKGARMSSRRFGRLIMQHELLTGIIPMFEKLPEVNLFAMRGKKVKYKGAPVGYAQRAANFQYFKHRFASRQMQCQGRFNPWFVPGFPGLIIDRPMDADKLVIAGLQMKDQLNALNIIPQQGMEVTRGTILRELVPTQFLGCCVQLTHTISQQGGNTSYAFAQARIHRESTEFLGVDKASVRKKIGTSRRGTLVAATPSRAPNPKKRGPRGGTVLSVVDVTRQYYDKFLPIYGAYKGTSKVKVGSKDVFTPKSLTMSLTSSDQGSQTGSQTSSQESFKAYRVVESFVRRERRDVDLPIEDVIRPPWIWDGYTNLRIGDTHMQFFGTNSITDIEGYTSDDLLALIESEDTYLATQEVQEGITYGTKKNDNDDSYYWSKETPEREQDKPSKNKVDKGGTSQEKEVGKKVSASAILAMETDRTIESSIDYLVRVYSFIKHHSLDIGEFLRNYTWRPVATLPEIMGSVNFNITSNEDYVPPKEGKSFIGADNQYFTSQKDEVKQEGEYVITGNEGFHSRAFGDRADLFGLVDPKVKKVLGLSEDAQHATAKKLDVRKLKREAVQRYAQELTDSKGLLG